jgi:hypothetical protein
LNVEQAKQNAQMDMFKEVASSQIMSITDTYKDSLGPGKFDQAKVDQFKAQVGVQMDTLQNAMIAGKISDAEMLEIAIKMQQAAMKGTVLDVSKIAGVQQHQKDSAANAKIEDDRNTKMVAAFEKLQTLLKTSSDYADTKKQRDFLEKAYPQTFKQLQQAERAGKKNEFIAALKKEKSVKTATMPGGATATGGKAPSGAKVATKTVTKPETKPTPTQTQTNTTKLSDTQAQTKLQVQMVKLIGISAQYLGEINSNTAKPTTNIGGKLISQTLLNQASKTFAIAGVPQY